jgi:hypothetical protein
MGAAPPQVLGPATHAPARDKFKKVLLLRVLENSERAREKGAKSSTSECF